MYKESKSSALMQTNILLPLLLILFFFQVLQPLFTN